MMDSSVLDSSALIAYLNGEPGAQVVDETLKDNEVKCYAHSINLCEVYYDAMRCDRPMSGQLNA